MLKIKKNDKVKVIAGKDKDKVGKVLAVNAKQNTVIVEGCGMIKKHSKPSMQNQAGGIIEKEGPIHISNVMLMDGDKAVRVGFEIRDGKKVRVAKQTGNVID
ncbi:MAG: 50S ribosomal protein L24 [Eubacteriales bacterium]|nr:50S ribosomal protein L24 [Eubacteriales bacterium]